ncbi:hypothetical protein N431DRAFT_457090 [Stipitochalara longipes BDJ]|nr:hypothetical protein N431DRAFT_457090 [Stipitochalara longipes BDJ]
MCESRLRPAQAIPSSNSKPTPRAVLEKLISLLLIPSQQAKQDKASSTGASAGITQEQQATFDKEDKEDCVKNEVRECETGRPTGPWLAFQSPVVAISRWSAWRRALGKIIEKWMRVPFGIRTSSGLGRVLSSLGHSGWACWEAAVTDIRLSPVPQTPLARGQHSARKQAQAQLTTSVARSQMSTKEAEQSLVSEAPAKQDFSLERSSMLCHITPGPGLIIDYLIFDHSALIMTLSEKAARVVGDYQSIHLLLGGDDQNVLKISRRSVVEIEARSSKSQAAQVADRAKGRSNPANRNHNHRVELGNLVYLVISNCGLQEGQKRRWRRRGKVCGPHAIVFLP